MTLENWKLALIGLAAGALAACGTGPATDSCDNLICPWGSVCEDGLCVPTTGPGGDDDAGVDAGPGEEDGGLEDAGFEYDGGVASAQLAEVRAQLDDAGYALPVQDVLVSYVAPEVGSDPAGFFLQAEPEGPAIFVLADAGVVSDPPSPGDVVSLEVNALGTQDGQRRVVAFSNYAKVAGGVPLASLSQDLSAATDVVSNLDGYESELVTATGTLLDDMGFGGVDHLSSDFSTQGIASDASFEFRVPLAVRDALDLTSGCNLTVHGTPMWRFKGKAQLSAWGPEEVTVNNCPAPRLLSAGATSATTVELTFDRQISTAPASAVQFDKALVALSTAPSGNVVTVTTGLQLSGVPYTVTLTPPDAVEDTLGTGVDATANTAQFNGYAPPAAIILNEVNPSISGGKDLVELKVTQAGSMKDFKLEQIGTASVVTLGTLPDVIVAAGDLIVVHLSVSSGTETTAKDQIPQATQTDYFDGAWDVQGNSSGMSVNDRVLRLVKPDATVADEVPFVTQTATPSSQFLDELTAMTTGGLWSPACAASPCDASDAPVLGVDWNGLQTSSASSVYRGNNAASKSAADWHKATTATSVTATFGAANP